ncbi:polyhydroxyalkanoic acid system family protein [Pseudomonas sp. SIMBA_077]
MAKEIYIKRTHALALDEAIKRAQSLVAKLADQYSLSHEWGGPVGKIKHGLTGVTGGIEIFKDAVVVHVDLSFFYRTFKGLIESKIHEALDQELGPV